MNLNCLFRIYLLVHIFPWFMFSNPEKWPNICLHRSCHTSTSLYLRNIYNFWWLYKNCSSSRYNFLNKYGENLELYQTNCRSSQFYKSMQMFSLTNMKCWPFSSNDCVNMEFLLAGYTRSFCSGVPCPAVSWGTISIIVWLYWYIIEQK